MFTESTDIICIFIILANIIPKQGNIPKWTLNSNILAENSVLEENV